MGHWKNFEELESNLSIGELTAVLKAQREKENKDRKFQAALQGIDLEKEEAESQLDIADLKGFQAQDAGFGVGEGIGVISLGVD